MLKVSILKRLIVSSMLIFFQISHSFLHPNSTVSSHSFQFHNSKFNKFESSLHSMLKSNGCLKTFSEIFF